MEKVRSLYSFLCSELGVEMSADRDEPRLVDFFQTKSGFIIYEEDFFLMVPGLEEPDIWEKIRDFYSSVSRTVFERQEGSLIEVEGEDKNILVAGSYYSENEFRITVNVW